MAQDPERDDLSAPAPASWSLAADPRPNGEPPTRRDRRAAAGRAPRRSRAWLWVLIGLLVVGAAGATAVWTLFEPQIRSVLGWVEPNDYDGDGNGETVNVLIDDGDIGADVARTLHESGVTKTFDAFYDLLLREDPIFTPGVYALQKQMSAESALAALLDEANRLEATALVREGIVLSQIFSALSDATGIPVADYEEAAADPASFGLPPEATSLEGWLFPATYPFNPGTTARQQLEVLVGEMFQRLDALDVAEADRYRLVTTASLIQREARIAEDFARVSRVIVNRMDAGMRLQFDSTSHYGFAWRTGESSAGDSVWTTDEERADDNPYNTYVHTGLPIGPISAPGEDALEAALNPADGSWLYFVTVDLDTGETVFSTTLAEHERAVAKLREWCRANPDSGC